VNKNTGSRIRLAESEIPLPALFTDFDKVMHILALYLQNEYIVNMSAS
jgi:hypothetical protein